MTVLSNGAQGRETIEKIINGFPLKPEILVERSYNSHHLTPLATYVLLLERLDGRKFSVRFDVADLTLAQAYDPEGILIETARNQISKAFNEIKEDDFFEAIQEWHLGDTDNGVTLKNYMHMTDEEYAFWEETGNMPESWEA